MLAQSDMVLRCFHTLCRVASLSWIWLGYVSSCSGFHVNLHHLMLASQIKLSSSWHDWNTVQIGIESNSLTHSSYHILTVLWCICRILVIEMYRLCHLWTGYVMCHMQGVIRNIHGISYAMYIIYLWTQCVSCMILCFFRLLQTKKTTIVWD